MIEVRRYVTNSGKDIFHEWSVNLKDERAQAKINLRIARLASGNFGDCKSLREGIFEMRIDYGPGYRVYFARIGMNVVLLLAGGDKRRQSVDIEYAIAFLRDYKQRLL